MSDVTLSQSHTGSGDNVGRDVIKITNFETYVTFISKSVPEDLQTPVKDILKRITNREFSKARENIDLISGFDNKNSEVKELLQLLKIKCDISEHQKEDIDLGEMQEIFGSSKNEMIKDLALSLIFKGEIVKHGIDIALKRYKATGSIGPYSRSAAFQLFEDKVFLLGVYESKLFTLIEEELIGLINGLFREECYQEAFLAAEHLCRMHDNDNSKIVLLFSRAYKLNSSIIKKDYWLLEQNEKDDVIQLINEVVNIFVGSNDADVRLFNIIIPSLFYVKSRNKQLEDICLKNIEKVDDFNKFFADELRLRNCKESLDDDHPVKIIEKAEENPSYNNSLIKSLIAKNKVDYNEIRMARKLMSYAEFESWIKEGVRIDGEFTSLGEKLNEIFISIAIKDSDSIKENLLEVYKDESDSLSDVSSEFIDMLVRSMQDIDLLHESCDLLLAYLDGLTNLWCSPIVESTLYSLYKAARYKDLLDLSLRVNDKDRTSDFDNLVIYTHLFHGSPEEAFELIKNYRHENNLEFLRLKLSAFIKLNKQECIDEEVKQFDYSLFESPLPVMKNIVALLIHCNQMEVVEKIILNWFIASPQDNYLYISDACLTLVINDKKVDFNPSYNINGISHAVTYKDGDRWLTKLISSEKSFKNLYILNPDSILSANLMNAKEGDEFVVGMKKIIVEEVLPPYVAIHRLSISFREQFNDGSDIFHSFSASNNPEELMMQIKQCLSLGRSNEQDLQSIVSNDVAPLSFRMNLINKSDPVKAAFNLLFDKNAHMKGFIDFGDESTDELCTDLITVMYICLTSLSKHFIKKGTKLFAINEDIEILTQWLEKIDTDNFLSMGESDSGDVFINTAEHIKKKLALFLKNLREILPVLSPLRIVPDNYNKEVNSLAENFGSNFSKQIYAFKNNGYPFFSIDSQVCLLIKSLLPINISNVSKILHEAREEVSFDERLEGLLIHIHGTIPYPLMVEDFFNLSLSNKDNDSFHISCLINKYAGNFNNNIKIAYFMSLIIAHCHDKAINGWHNKDLIYVNQPFGPRIDRVFNSACIAICSNKNDEDRESNLAKFFSVLLSYGLHNESFARLMSQLAYQYSVGNFLDLSKIRSIVMDVFSGKTKV
ncbi:hypothetical protein [Pantoea agglomerans]|uniref:hypothetical protein n=1 Tax=Enterobacter agglomerans TaxID=549 RepID=UPI002B1E35BB|nr:hypothetical protein [Pantoea agglomerans]